MDAPVDPKKPSSSAIVSTQAPPTDTRIQDENHLNGSRAKLPSEEYADFLSFSDSDDPITKQELRELRSPIFGSLTRVANDRVSFRSVWIIDAFFVFPLICLAGFVPYGSGLLISDEFLPGPMSKLLSHFGMPFAFFREIEWPMHGPGHHFAGDIAAEYVKVFSWTALWTDVLICAGLATFVGWLRARYWWSHGGIEIARRYAASKKPILADALIRGVWLMVSVPVIIVVCVTFTFMIGSLFRRVY